MYSRQINVGSSIHLTFQQLKATDSSKENNEPERFLPYLFSARQTVQPGIRETKAGLLLCTKMPDTEANLSAFLKFANDIPEHVMFVDVSGGLGGIVPKKLSSSQAGLW